MYPSCYVEFSYTGKPREGILVEMVNVNEDKERWLVATEFGMRTFYRKNVESGIASQPVLGENHKRFMNALQKAQPEMVDKYVLPVVNQYVLKRG